MSKEITKAVVIALIVTCVKGDVAYWNSPNQLQPVHGLYVKPSNDGSTGDLYVAASEDSRGKAQWLTDQPVKFLPAATATQPLQTAVPPFIPSYSSSSHDEDVATQKRAVFTNPPLQYAYALPVPSGNPTEGSAITPYPYAITSTPPETSKIPQCPIDPNSAIMPQYSPYHFFYPHMMSAFSNAMSVLKEAGVNEDTAGSVVSQASPMWPPVSYPYPMYVMVDPNAWAHSGYSQSSTAASTSATSEKSS